MAVHTTAILIVSNLLLGILFAIAHHVFYESLNGQVVVDQHQQEWYLRIGTGLSFAVRTLLSASIGSAYVQLIWYNVKYASISINGLDALFGVLSNVWDFAIWELWRTRPVLTIVAVAIWILPLIAVVTPATLTIESAKNPRAYDTTLPLPLPDYSEPWKYADINNYDYFDYYSNYTYNYTFFQASSRVLRLFNSVISMGTTLAISPPFPNSSYTLEFYGPSIACETLGLNSNLAQLTIDMLRDRRSKYYWESMPYYAGFIPNSYCEDDSDCLGEEDEDEIALRALRQAMNSTLVANLASFDNVSEEYAKVYVLMQNRASHTPYTTIRCGFCNSSYLVQANFIDGRQEISYTTTVLNGLSPRNAISCYNQDPNLCGADIAYLSILDALGKVLVGTLSDSNPYFSSSSITPTRTQILTTVLSQSWEFRTLPQMKQGPIAITNMSLARALEQVVANTTVSLLTDSYFLQDQRRATNKVVTVRSPQNAYSYKSRNLLIAYCLGCAVTTLVAAFGLKCTCSASASYSTRFSTILRTTEGLHADAGISPAETSGAEPIPPSLAKTHVILRRQVTPSRDDNESQAWAFSVMNRESKVSRDLDRGLSLESLFQLSVQVQPPTVVSAPLNDEGNR